MHKHTFSRKLPQWKSSKRKLSSFLLLSSLALLAQAQDNERGSLEADLFGSSDVKTIDDTSVFGDSREDELFGGSSTEDELFGGSSTEDELFGGSSQSSSSESFKDLLSDKLDKKDAQFDIGGNYYHSLNFSAANSQETRAVGLSSDGVVDIYFDAALDESVRFFLKQKIRHDFTEGGESGNALTFQAPEASTSIDQLWLKFNYQNSLYVTAGKQPTSWGSGFVWAPTDFINSLADSPFSLSDQRLGVSLIKFQYPFDKQGINIYAVFQTTDVGIIEDVRSLFRAEFIGEQSEFALSVSSKSHDQLQLGGDLSMGLGPVDIFVNVAVTHHDTSVYYDPPPEGSEVSADDYVALAQSTVDGGVTEAPANTTLETIDRSGEVLKEASTGFIYIDSYEDGTQLIVNGEFFYNEKGYESSDFLTVYLLQNNFEFDPLYFSRRYAALGLTRAGLGRGNTTSLSLQYIKNLTDATGAAVVSVSTKPFRDLSFSSNLVVFTGHDGTFRPFVNDTPELQEAAQRIANGELVIPEGVLPAGLQAPVAGQADQTQTAEPQSFDVPRYMLSTQLSLSY